MHQKNPPQTTNNSTVRDAAVQIDVEDNPWEKADAIWEGAKLDVLKDHPEYKPEMVNFGAGFWLALQLQHLTSTDKFTRDRAKENVRKLVKLGKGE